MEFLWCTLVYHSMPRARAFSAREAPARMAKQEWHGASMQAVTGGAHTLISALGGSTKADASAATDPKRQVCGRGKGFCGGLGSSADGHWWGCSEGR